MRGRIGPRVIRATVFKAASSERWKDAQCLYAAGRYQGAIYLSGYALECQLKANVCSTRRVKFLEESYAKSLGHDLARALHAAGLNRKLSNNEDLRVAFLEIANRWSTGIRYSGGGSNKGECERFLKDSEGLLSWLRKESRL